MNNVLPDYYCANCKRTFSDRAEEGISYIIAAFVEFELWIFRASLFSMALWVIDAASLVSKITIAAAKIGLAPLSTLNPGSPDSSMKTSIGHQLHVDGALLHRHGRLLDRLGQRRVGMAGAGEVFRGAAEFHQHGAFMDKLAGLWADDVGAEHPVG
jgi:hypothetical protein